MIYRVTHRTTYRYAARAVFSQHLMRLTPRQSSAQRVLQTRVKISPEPDTLGEERDMFGNLAHVATVARPHGQLDIEAESLIERNEPSEFIAQASCPWEDACDAALGLTGQGPVLSAAPFAFPSEMTGSDGDIAAYARESFTPGRALLEAAADLTARIYADFEYVPGSTVSETLPQQSFARRRGVCQDFAHVMLAGLRALRVPARYVSGYLRTIPPEGQERLQGADASHAWVSVWDPVFDWVDFDPTNDVIPGIDHVTLAWGRDFADVSPVAGIVVGSGGQTLSVGVDVVEAPG
ncbi:MAG: transglutaminase family protein [Pseudomonadota bacterium]